MQIEYESELIIFTLEFMNCLGHSYDQSKNEKMNSIAHLVKNETSKNLICKD